MPVVTGRRGRAPAYLLVAAVLGAFSPVVGNGFILLDDWTYLLRNPHLADGITAGSLRWACTESYAANWSPLTWVAHLLAVRLFGLAPPGHHLVNLLLHALVAALLFRVLRAMTGRPWPSALAAALFALHPLRVESVAWASCLKDGLSGLCWVLALGAHLRYARRPSAGRALALALVFALGLMAKPAVVTLPFVLLLLDVWPLGRLARPGGAGGTGPHGIPWQGAAGLVREKIPLFLLAGASSVVTYRVQASWGAMDHFGALPLGDRAGNALVSYAAYLGKTLLPRDLAIYYPHPGHFAGIGRVAAALLLLLAVSALAAASFRRRPWLAVGWCWFLGTLVPMIGLVQVGAQAFADRYAYLPHMGLALAVAWGAAEAVARRPGTRAAAVGFAGAVLVALALVSRQNTRNWKDDLSIFGHAAAVTRDNWLAENNLGVAWGTLGDEGKAREHFTEALRIRPGYPMAEENLRRLREAQALRPAPPAGE